MKEPFVRMRNLALRLSVAALTVMLLVSCSVRIYMASVARRSIALLNEAADLKLGATENSILPFVARYRGAKWFPRVANDLSDCLDRAACAEEIRNRSEYQYGFVISPFSVLPSASSKAESGRVHQLLTLLMLRVPSEWRDPFGLRDSWTVVDVAIRNGRVSGVSANIYVEGRKRWLGNSWNLDDREPRTELRGKSYAIDGTFLTFPGYGGAGTVHYLTSNAAPEQFKSAQSFNERCITGLVPCRCLSDLTPVAFEYLGAHPDIGSSVETDDCSYRLSRR